MTETEMTTKDAVLKIAALAEEMTQSNSKLKPLATAILAVATAAMLDEKVGLPLGMLLFQEPIEMIGQVSTKIIQGMEKLKKEEAEWPAEI